MRDYTASEDEYVLFPPSRIRSFTRLRDLKRAIDRAEVTIPAFVVSGSVSKTETEATLLASSRAALLARFPLSRISEAFFDDMLGVLPPAHIQRVPGFFVTEAVSEDVHAHFVHAGGRFYGAYVALGDPATFITYARIAAFDAVNPAPPVLAWYPDD